MTNSTTQQLGATVSRVALGGLLVSHGVLKLQVFTVAGTVGYFANLGLPAEAAYLTIFGEVVGGAAILLGVLPRLAAALSLPILLGAVWAHSGNGWVFSNANGGWEFPAFLAAIAASVALQGGGRFALGNLPIVQKLLPKFLRK
jgi:putative oxidoreductase